MERQLLNARVEIEKVQIELSGTDRDESGELDGRSASLTSLPKQTLYETVGKYLDFFGDGLSRFPPTSLPRPKKDFLNPDNSCGSAELADTPGVGKIFKLQEEAMKHQKEVVRLVASALEKFELPKREFLSLDGDPKKYPRFIKSFKINVPWRRLKEGDERLSFLIQYC